MKGTITGTLINTVLLKKLLYNIKNSNRSTGTQKSSIVPECLMMIDDNLTH